MLYNLFWKLQNLPILHHIPLHAHLHCILKNRPLGKKIVQAAKTRKYEDDIEENGIREAFENCMSSFSAANQASIAAAKEESKEQADLKKKIFSCMKRHPSQRQFSCFLEGLMTKVCSIVLCCAKNVSIN